MGGGEIEEGEDAQPFEGSQQSRLPFAIGGLVGHLSRGEGHRDPAPDAGSIDTLVEKEDIPDDQLTELNFRPVSELNTSLSMFVWRATAVLRYQPSLVRQMFKRDFTAVYRSSKLGLFWLVLTPLATMSSWLLLRYSGVVLDSTTAGAGGGSTADFILLLLVNITLWSGFRTVIGTLRNSMRRSSLLLQVRFPHEAVLLQNLLTSAVQMVIPVILLLIFVVLSGNAGGLVGALLFPLAVIPLYIAATAVGLVAAPLSVVFPDVTRAIDVVLGFMFVATPIIYQREIIADKEFVNTAVGWNPLTHLLGWPRDLLLGETTTSLLPLLGSIGGSVVLLLFAIRLFSVGSRLVAERLV